MKHVYLTVITCITFMAFTSITYAFNERETQSSPAVLFKAAYASYKEELALEDKESALRYAIESHKHGVEHFGAKHINTANLALNIVNIHIELNQFDKSMVYLDDIIDTYENEFGKNSLELAEVYITYIPVFISQRDEHKIRVILSISKKFNETAPLSYADLQLEAGMALLRLGSKASKAILKAQNTYTEHLPEDAVSRIKANFFAGKYYLALGKNRKATKAFSKNLPAFAKLEGAEHHLELATHAFLVRAFEELGDSDSATVHCIAIGKMQPREDDQNPQPLYRVNPYYPTSAARSGKTGFTQVQFNIDEYGLVNDLRIIENEGHEKFKQTSIEAIKKWRYAPRFVDGKAVESQAHVRLDYTMGR